MSDARNRSARSRLGRAPMFTEVAAVALTPAALFGFIRIFDQAADVLPIIAAAAASSALAIILRHLRVPLILAAPLSLFVLATVLVNLLAPGTTEFAVLPTEQTRTILAAIADEGLEQFRSQRSPVDAIDGFLAAAAVGAWLSAFIVDWAALRLRLAFEPVLPAGLLFVFTSVIGSGEYRLLTTAVFASALIVWTSAHRLDRERRLLWLTADRRRGPARLAGGAASFGVVAVAIGLLVGPLIPGAGEVGLLDWRNGGDPTRVVVSPFVDIGARLVDQRDIELFAVTTERPSYYRLAGLDTYENGVWLSRGQESVEEDGILPGRRPTAGTTHNVRQDFRMQNLSQEWLPAAFAPSEIIESDARFNWIADTGSLIVEESRGSVDGLEYSIESIVPDYSAAELRAASTNAPAAIRQRYLDLDGVTPTIATTARDLTQGASSDYDALIMIQDFFRRFDYSVSLSPRSGDPIEQFLDEQVGFCQQFSGTFALMARSLGIPARVAVGFTWGQPVVGEPGSYQITGRHTHAWPEVYFDDLGWVSFEPTPGRGSPSATAYAGHGADQDDPVQPDNPFDTTTTTTPGETEAGSTDTTGPEFQDPEFPGGTAGTGTGGGGGGFEFNRQWLIGLLVATTIVGGLPLLQHVRRLRRRQRAVSPAERIDTVWAEVAESLERRRGILRTPSETRSDFCERLSAQRRFDYLPFPTLGTLVTAARFAPELVSTDDAEEAEAAGDKIIADLRAEHSAVRRWWHDADPRRLLRPTVRIRVR